MVRLSLCLRRIVAPLGLPAVLLIAPACDPGLMLGAGAATLVATDKTLGDHAISAATGRDCSTARASRGESFCKPAPHVMAAQHCYRTLGGISCYTQPDRQASESNAVPDVPPMPIADRSLDLGVFEIPLPGGSDDAGEVSPAAPAAPALDAPSDFGDTARVPRK
jgi:hypothetical protein